MRRESCRRYGAIAPRHRNGHAPATRHGLHRCAVGALMSLATLLAGGKAPILEGAMMSWVIKPFIKLERPYDDLYEWAEQVWDWWDENGKMRERLGELIDRVGMRVFLKEMGVKPVPQMVKYPRPNPYFFWWPEEVPQRKES